MRCGDDPGVFGALSGDDGAGGVFVSGHDPDARAGGDATVYSGKLRGEAARFTVHADKSVEFQYGDKIYGPYTVTEDPDARPDSELSRYLTGVEVRCGDTILFRGGVMENGGETLLYHEDGSIDLDLSITATSSGVTLDENGNEVDPMELSARTILELTEGPELQHKGSGPRGSAVCSSAP